MNATTAHVAAATRLAAVADVLRANVEILERHGYRPTDLADYITSDTVNAGYVLDVSIPFWLAKVTDTAEKLIGVNYRVEGRRVRAHGDIDKTHEGEALMAVITAVCIAR